MNREIKFRFIYGIDGEENTYFSKVFTFGEIGNGCHWEELSDNPLYRDYSILAKHQFTGLLDKHGKEIYDSDVIDEKYKCQVIWEGACWWVKSLGTDHKYPLARFLAMREMAGTPCEIIGNIYENPELLEGK